MRQYESKQELLATIQDKFQKYIAEFKDIPEHLKDQRIEEVDKTPSENLSYQLGWINLLLRWDQEELKGINVQTPTADYKWNNLGGLYQSFYAEYGHYSLAEQISQLESSLNELEIWINSLSTQELFEPKQRNWATTKAEWPLYKWIHINTVAPFTNFRTKIRKWKKIVL